MISFENYEIVELPVDSNLKKENQQNWALAPMHVLPKDVKKANKFLNMISNKEINTPCSLAKIPEETVKKFLFLKTIDSEFRRAMDEYEESLIDAINKDLEMAKIKHIYSKEDFIGAVAKGVLSGGKMGCISYIWLITIPVGILLGGAYGLTDRFLYQYTGQKINVENSENRKIWLDTVSLKEKQRIKCHIEKIKNRVLTLQKGLEEDTDIQLVDDKLVEEMKALDQLVTILSPKNPMKIEDNNTSKTISEYLEKFF